MTDALKFDRRALLGGAALAGAAALTAGTTGTVSAAAPKQGLSRPTLYRFGVGDFEVTTILDGAVQLDGPQPIFGQNASAEEVAKLAEENFLPVGRMEIAFTVTVVNTGSEVILFDSGNGLNGFVPRPNAGRLRALLAEAGIAPEQVDIVALTHFHRDHIGGLMEADGTSFPNASYVIASTEYDFWSDETLVGHDGLGATAKVVQSSVVPNAPKTRFIKAGDSVVSGITALASHGHTPGHTSYHLESQGRRLLIMGDVCNHYVMSLQRPDWHVAFDMDKEQAVAARKEVLGMIATDRIPFVGYHMPPPAVGYLEAKGEGFRFVPVGYQLNL
jgi:glyoxylase-like metal-dependent hydrolase (beta-lactamase superfamily II)